MFLFLVLVFLVNISSGSVTIPFRDILSEILGQNPLKDSHQYILLNFRLPKAITAILVGSGLSVSGLLMQTLFRNPLAGPFVLGISSGASLGVALLIMGSSLLGGGFLWLNNSPLSLVIAGSLGSLLILLTVLVVAQNVKNTMAILIIGLMFGSFTGALISILSYFSSAQNLQQYIFWSFGNLGTSNWSSLGIFFGVYLISILMILPNITSLNTLLLGENYAQSLGLSLKRTRNQILIITSVLTGLITAFAGPIAFIGLAVPHMAKLIFQTSNHKILVPASLLLGASIMLICDTIAQVPGSEYVLPINAITSLFGAPLVIYLLIRKKKLT